MNVVRWSPFREFDHLLEGFERPAAAPLRRADWLPLVDIRETDHNYQIDVEVPAVASEDLSVSVQDGVLSVSGERKSARNDETDKVHRTERRYGRFLRHFQLPEDADPEAVTATTRDGVLYLSIGKTPAKMPRTIEVKVS